MLARPPTVTTTLPVVAPAGTGTTMLVADQLVGVAVVPLNLTVLVPCVAPKFVPVIVTDVPTGPLVGERLVMLGGDRDGEGQRRCSPAPPTVTTTLPVVAPAGTGTTMLVADQLVGVAVVPLNLTVLVPLRRAEVRAGDRDRRADRAAGRREPRDARCRAAPA